MKFRKELALGILGLMAAVSALADAPPAVACYQSAMIAISSAYGDNAADDQVTISQRAIQLCSGARSEAPVVCYKAAMEAISPAYGAYAANDQVTIAGEAIRLCAAAAN